MLESGIHDSSDPWALTQMEPPVASSPAVSSGTARFTRVCRYDRPGTIRYTNPPALTTRSTPVEMPRTLPEMAADLRSLLRRSGIRGPVILVGHSLEARSSGSSPFETIHIDGSIDAILQGPALPRVPLAVISKTEPFATAPGLSRPS